MDFILETPSDIALKIARRIKNIRKRRKITQKQMATSVSLIKVVMELGLINEINDLFTQPVYLSIEEVINDRK